MATLLTPHQERVLRWVANGWTEREIAAKLRVSRRSVEIAKCRIYTKLNARNAPHAVAIYLRQA